jgi:hypothetical protein
MSEDLETALAFARGLALAACDAMRWRLAYEPEVVSQSDTDVQFALVTETGSRFNVTVAYSGNTWDSEVAAMQEP